MKRVVLLTCAVFIALVCASAHAAAPATPSKSDANAAALGAPVASPAKHFDADAATAEWMATLSPEARARSDAYYEGGYWLLLWDAVTAALVAWLILQSGLSARMRDWVERLTRFRWLQTACYAAMLIVLMDLILLPWSAYEGYFREHQYGMSNQSLGAWLEDQGITLALMTVIGALVITGIYAAIRRAPRSWWIWGALVGIVFAAVGTAAGPVYIEPLYNKFTPLTESPLKQDILALARANGIPATDVYEFDASKQTKRMSAHVSGLFGTTQISLNDNLMDRASPDEVKAVLGHEMGHYVLHHVFHGILESIIVLVITFGFLKWGFESARLRWGGRWGIRDVGDVAGMPLMAILLVLFNLAITPVQNTLIRTQEQEADMFGLNAAREPDGAAQAAIHLSEYRKMQPGTLEEWLFYDHPSGWNRIHRAMVWKAEHIDDADIAHYDAAHPTIAMPPGEQR